ncbi:MAG TPA: PIG-L family deacetylase [Verrucomicrobiae bacterium]|jgi:LmbE family N-acetylglucosaminyl deacetylase|nr:PIG-L family deacetylase [Verrucomicrobiae bacterium]
MQPYNQFVQYYEQLYRDGKKIPLGGFENAAKPQIAADAPKVLIFSPHPDDECIIGALPLRLLREAKMRVINVAVTQGSKQERQAERLAELKRACEFMRYELIQTHPNGLERVNAKTREQDSGFWRESVAVIADILKRTAPKIVFFPHEQDWNSSHIGTHYLVTDALKSIPGFESYVVETEYWGANPQPNLMVQSTVQDVADMVAGTSCHVGEVTRNPFHLFLPAWMQENVRRGSELVGGQGKAAPDWTFATLYRMRQWRKGGFEEVLPKGRLLPMGQDPAALFS